MKAIIFILGSFFIVIQFIPVGSYYFIGQPHFSGDLYNFIFPSGMLSIVLGIILIFHNRLNLNKIIKLNYLMIISGILILLVSYFQSTDYFLGLWHGVKGNFDTEGFNGVIIGLLSIFTGIIIKQLDSNDKWKIGAIIGGIWGFTCVATISGEIWLNPVIKYTFYLPVILSLTIAEIWHSYLILYLLAISYGALIGGSTGYLIDKYI